MWIAVLQLTLVIFIRFYQTYYQMNFFVQMSLVLNFTIFGVWTIVLAIYVMKRMSDSVTALVAFCVSAGGYIFFFSLALASLKYMTLPDKSKLPLGHRLLFSFAFLILGGAGILILIFGSSSIVWGHTLCGISIYLVVLINLPLHRM
jgi:hypothetical protein